MRNHIIASYSRLPQTKIEVGQQIPNPVEQKCKKPNMAEIANKGQYNYLAKTPQ